MSMVSLAMNNAFMHAIPMQQQQYFRLCGSAARLSILNVLHARQVNQAKSALINRNIGSAGLKPPAAAVLPGERCFNARVDLLALVQFSAALNCMERGIAAVL